MIVQPDLLVKDLLAATITEVEADVTLLEEVFFARPLVERLEIREYFANHPVPVRLGFPRNATELPGIYVSLGATREVQEPIGSLIGNEETSLVWHEHNGSLFETSVRVACWTLNANLTAWLQALAAWGLLRGRQTLNDQGINRQVLNASDFEPLPQWFPDFAFRRDLTLTGQHFDTYETIFGKLAAIDVEASGEGDDQPVVVRIE